MANTVQCPHNYYVYANKNQTQMGIFPLFHRYIKHPLARMRSDYHFLKEADTYAHRRYAINAIKCIAYRG